MIDHQINCQIVLVVSSVVWPWVFPLVWPRVSVAPGFRSLLARSIPLVPKFRWNPSKRDHTAEFFPPRLPFEQIEHPGKTALVFNLFS